MLRGPLAQLPWSQGQSYLLQVLSNFLCHVQFLLGLWKITVGDKLSHFTRILFEPACWHWYKMQVAFNTSKSKPEALKIVSHFHGYQDGLEHRSHLSLHRYCMSQANSLVEEFIIALKIVSNRPLTIGKEFKYFFFIAEANRCCNRFVCIGG